MAFQSQNMLISWTFIDIADVEKKTETKLLKCGEWVKQRLVLTFNAGRKIEFMNTKIREL